MIQKYDTLKDTAGKTWRVVSVGEDGNTMEVKGVNENGKLKPGRTRTIRKEDIGQEYRLLDLPNVKVVKAPNLTHAEEVKEILASVDPDAIDELITSDAEKMLEAENDELRAKLKMAHDDLDALENEVAELRKTISKTKQTHEAEVAELNDEIMELKILAKKKNEYADALDDDSVAFRKIRSMSAAIVGMADSISNLAFLLQDETEGRI